MEWLLQTAVFQAMQAAVESGGGPTAAQEAAEIEARDRSGDSILSVAGDKAQIDISGVLTQRPNYLARIFGGGNTTYAEITAALADAEQDPNVTEITLAIDSPGGSIAGLFDTLAALQGAQKPLRAVVYNLGASAAYAVAAQAGEIIAANKAVRVGSVGVAARFLVDENEVLLHSTDAPLKNPDVRTPEGKAAVTSQLDDIHEVFVDAIAVGRNITVEKVNADFGRGATVLAEEAERRGMIDGVSAGSQGTVTSGGGERNTEAKGMDLNEFKASHPDVYEAAVKVGTDAERDRVTAHLTMGEGSGKGALDTAVKAIRDGSPMTQTLMAEYMTKSRDNADVGARAGDEAEAAAAADGTGAPAKDEDDTVASMVAGLLGAGEG